MDLQFARSELTNQKKGKRKMENYYKDLARLQNHSENSHVDIMTITDFMNQRQKIDHIIYYAVLCKDQLIQKRYERI